MKNENIERKEVLNPLRFQNKGFTKPNWIRTLKHNISKDTVRIDIDIPNLIMDCYHVRVEGNNLQLNAGLHFKEKDFRIKDVCIPLKCEIESNFISHSVENKTIKILMKRKTD